MLRDNVMARYDVDVSVFAYPYTRDVLSVVDELGSRCHVYAVGANMFEFPAIRSLVDSPSDVNLYFHTKGASVPVGGARKPGEHKWDADMSYFNLVMCSTCIAHLASHDGCGIAFTVDKLYGDHVGCGYYAGNFWWATGRYLRGLQGSRFIRAPVDRFDAERMVGGSRGSFMSLWMPRGGQWDDDHDSGERILNPVVYITP
jgi:hypothetical protein